MINPDNCLPRVVATYTTVPSRYDLLEKSIRSLLLQTHKPDIIYVTIPRRSSRLNQDYPPLPQQLEELCTIIHIEADYGPITKIYGALVSEEHPNTIILSCDDDILFPPSHLETILKYHELYPKSVLSGTGALVSKGVPFISITASIIPFHNLKEFTGFILNKNSSRSVDLIYGSAGVLYTRSMFPHKDFLYEELFRYSSYSNELFANDDIVISGYLSKNNIDRRVFYNIPEVQHMSGADALSSNIFRMIYRMHLAIQQSKTLGLFPKMEPLELHETPLGKVIIVILIIISICICIFLYQHQEF